VGRSEHSRSSGPGPQTRPANQDACSLCGVRGVSVCAPLQAAGLAAVEEIKSKIKLAPGETLLDEAEPAVDLFSVTEGCIKLFKLLADGRRQITGFLFEGDFLGLASGNTYAYSAEAVTAARLCRFNRKAFKQLLLNHPEMEHALLERTSNELAQAQEQMVLLGRKTAKERIASFLIQLRNRHLPKGQDGVVTVPMSRSDIADYLGLTTETVSRTLTRLKNEGAIEVIGSGQIRLLRPDDLTEIAEAS